MAAAYEPVRLDVGQLDRVAAGLTIFGIPINMGENGNFGIGNTGENNVGLFNSGSGNFGIANGSSGNSGIYNGQNKTKTKPARPGPIISASAMATTILSLPFLKQAMTISASAMEMATKQ
ncbi:MAG: pentapeptide repeat-containing protein [Geminicoccaceae bacterium]